MQASFSLIQALSPLSAELVAQRRMSFLDGSFVDHPAKHGSRRRSGTPINLADPNQSRLFLRVALGSNTRFMISGWEASSLATESEVSSYRNRS